MNISEHDLVAFVRKHIHLSPEQIFDYIKGNLREDEIEPIDNHLSACVFCRKEAEIWTELRKCISEVAEEDDDDEYSLEELVSGAQDARPRRDRIGIAGRRYILVPSLTERGRLEIVGLKCQDVDDCRAGKVKGDRNVLVIVGPNTGSLQTELSNFEVSKEQEVPVRLAAASKRTKDEPETILACTVDRRRIKLILDKGSDKVFLEID